MLAWFRSAAVFAAAATTLVTIAPTAAADDPLGGPLLAGSDVVVDRHPGTPRPPSVDATSYVLADLETGAILAGKAAHRRLRPASTLKMLTALTLLPRLDLDDTYTATYEDDAQIGSAVGIVEGSTYTIDELFLGLFLASGNDAAHALANAAGGTDKTVRLMREEAERIQALDTTPMNPSGLDAEGQLSSAYDLALIGRAGLQIEEFRGYAATERAQFPDADRSASYGISNHNQLLGTYRGTIGIKNGYTSKAGYTYAGAATRGGQTLIVALMQGQSDVQQEAARLMDWGFEYGEAVDPVGILVDPVPDEPPASATPTAGVAGPGSAGNRDAFGLPGGEDLPVAPILGGLGLIAGSAGAAITVRRVRRRRAVRAGLVKWATSRPRPGPSAPYGRPDGRRPGPPAISPPPAVRRLPPLPLRGSSQPVREQAEVVPVTRPPGPPSWGPPPPNPPRPGSPAPPPAPPPAARPTAEPPPSARPALPAPSARPSAGNMPPPPLRGREPTANPPRAPRRRPQENDRNGEPPSRYR